MASSDRGKVERAASSLLSSDESPDFSTDTTSGGRKVGVTCYSLMRLKGQAPHSALASMGGGEVIGFFFFLLFLARGAQLLSKSFVFLGCPFLDPLAKDCWLLLELLLSPLTFLFCQHLHLQVWRIYGKREALESITVIPQNPKFLASPSSSLHLSEYSRVYPIHSTLSCTGEIRESTSISSSLTWQ